MERRSPIGVVLVALVLVAALVTWALRTPAEHAVDRGGVPSASSPIDPNTPPKVPTSLTGGESPALEPRPRERTAARLPPAYEPWKEAPPPLRGVSGLVRDAITRAPIRGAWLSWRLPPEEISARVFADNTLQDPAFGMITDAQGRFRVDRLPHDAPISHTLFAVATGYAYAAKTVGLRGSLTYDLFPMGTLDVEVTGPLTGNLARVAVRPAGWTHAPIVRRVAPGRSTFAHVAPGLCRVSVDEGFGGPSQTVAILPGQVAHVRLSQMILKQVAGVLSSPSGNLSHTTVLFVETTSYERYEARTHELGNFERLLPRGRYAAFWQDGMSERRLPGEFDAGGNPLALEWDPSTQARVELHLDRGGKPLYEHSQLGLVALDAPFGSLIAVRSRRGGGFEAEAAPGTYALFEDMTYWGRVDVPGVVTRTLDPVTASITWGVDGLGADEIVRGEFSATPLDLSESRPDLARRFGEGRPHELRAQRGGRPHELKLGAPGRYRLEGQSDLGPFRVGVELPGDGVRVDLLAPSGN